MAYSPAYIGDAARHLPNNLKSFYFVRHGSTDHNQRGLSQGWSDIDLNDKGKDEAVALQSLVSLFPIRHIVCSPLARATKTAELATEGLGVSIGVDDRLKERGFGKYEGTEPPPGMYEGNFETCENSVVFASRVAKSLEHCTHPDVALFGHGCVLRTILALLGTNVRHQNDRMNTQLLHFRNDGQGWNLINLSDKIKSITAQEVFDGNGRPVLEVSVETELGAVGHGAAPTGTTVGRNEPHVLRDGDTSRYGGLGVLKALRNVNDIIGPSLKGRYVFCQADADESMRRLDGTSNLSNLGGNAIGSVSIAISSAAAASRNMPLYRHISDCDVKEVPVPCFHIVSGVRSLDRRDLVNEYLFVPHGAKTFDEAAQMMHDVNKKLAEILAERFGCKPEMGSSYGYKAPSQDTKLMLTLINDAISACGHSGHAAIALDCAASGIYNKVTDTYSFMGEQVGTDALIDYFKVLTEAFEIVFIEDPFDEDDFVSHAKAVREVSRSIIIGDDLTVSNYELLKRAHETQAVEGFVLKPNQAGTVSEAMKAYGYASDSGMIIVTSIRAGGVAGDVVADMAIGCQIQFFKTGAMRGDRIYNSNALKRVSEQFGLPLCDVKPLLRF